MIKITNEIEGKLYELVDGRFCGCDGCSFLNKDNDCLLTKEQSEFCSTHVCAQLGGIWKEVKDGKATK